MSIRKIKRYHQALQACCIVVRRLERIRFETEAEVLACGLVQIKLKAIF